MTPEQFTQWCNPSLIKTSDDVRAYRAMHNRKLGVIPTELRVTPEQYQAICDVIAPGQRIDEAEIQGVRVCV